MQSSTFSFSVPLDASSSSTSSGANASNLGVFPVGTAAGPSSSLSSSAIATLSRPAQTSHSQAQQTCSLTLQPSLASTKAPATTVPVPVPVSAPPSTLPMQIPKTINPALVARELRLSKRSAEERETQARIASRFQAKLASDHASVLHPEVDTPFADYEDVVRRLLPYHVFQIPWDDVQAVIDACTRRRTGISNKVSMDSGRIEVAETKFGLECCRRRKRLKERFGETLIRAGRRLAPDDQAYYLAQVAHEEEKLAHSALTNELKAARAELDRIEREKRASQRATQQQPTAQPTTQYRQHGLPQYGQPYSSTLNPPAGGQLQLYPTPAPAPTPTVNPASTTDVQVPISALPALHALGIFPVPMGSVQAEGSQPPAALIKATNSTTLTIQFNFGQLHANQMTGLAILLQNLNNARPLVGASVGSTSGGS